MSKPVDVQRFSTSTLSVDQSYKCSLSLMMPMQFVLLPLYTRSRALVLFLKLLTITRYHIAL